MNMKWKYKFKKTTLEKGKAAFQGQKVFDLTETSIGYKASVMGKQMYQVSVKIEDDSLTGIRCSCPAAKGGIYCEHMAAVLYAVERKNRAENGNNIENEEASASNLMKEWLKIDAALREEEKQEMEKAAREAEEKHASRWEAEVAAARKAVEEKLRAAKAKRDAAKTAASAKKKEKQNPEEVQKSEEVQKMDAEREERRLAREQRKAEQARRKEEQRRQMEEAQRAESEKRRAEEARREKIRLQKAEEAKRKADKKQKEQAMSRILEQKRKEEKMRREAERKKEEMRRQREMKKEEERKRLAEEAARQAEEEMRRREEAVRLAREKRKAEYALLGDSWEEDSEAQQMPSSMDSVVKLERYNYFLGTRIKNSTDIPAALFKEGDALLERGDIVIKHVVSGYEQGSTELKGMIEADGKSGKKEFEIRVIFSRTEATDCYCGCPQCNKSYYAWYSRKSNCIYTAGVLRALESFLQNNNIGDATDMGAERLLTYYQKKRGNLLMADVTSKEESLHLQPRLTRKNGKLSVSFRIGENKFFIVKKLDAFCKNVKNAVTDTYGTKTQINHNLVNFTEDAKRWIRFINRIVREEEEFHQRMLESRGYYGYRSAGIGSELNLFGWRLDEFYSQLADETIEFDDKDSREKKKEFLSCKKKNPKVTMRISAEKRKDDNQFHGIKVEGSLPDLYYGTDAAYYVKDGSINQVDKEFLEKIEPLANMSGDGRFCFHVGRNHMSEFYHRILPGLQDVVDVTETEPDKFRSYLLPEARFTFYLDVEDQNVLCQIFARYGDREVCALDVLKRQEARPAEPFRDFNREEEIVRAAMQFLPEADLEKEELHCGADEDLVYQMMESGADKLMELGEVRCTQRFRGYHVVKSMKVSVGVSVSSGLLELDISTGDIPQSELLDILASYRAKKKYYRMKDGSFVNLEDTSIEMLAELMDAAHLKPKEFVKGKLHLPMYRTLYLDKMLEENESVYSNRDSHFRKVVKGFKTVKDADFEEPKSLSKIMRNYQKNGFKWLRTLENWQFGGILADDMGLGKTLQIISVLLAAKQEGVEGTALIVAPASLVYNWGEEFERFAPELRVTLVTGTQEERQEKIEVYQEADVMVTSYDLLKRDIVYYEEKQFSYEVIDEAQYIKNHTTAAAKAVKIINSRIRFALTGTPIENRLSELWSIFDYLMPGFLYGYDVFKREIETPIVRYSDETAMKRLQKMAGPFILRRLKEEVLKDLPDKLEESRYVRFGSKQQQLYDAQVVHMRETLASQDDAEFNKNKIQILSELTRLRQICCDPSLCFENYNGEAAKLEACLQLVQSAIDGGHRMLLFSQFTSMLDILKEKLDSEKIAYYMITGSTSKEKRLQLVKAFNEGDVPVFLISLKAGGVGLNLTGADVVIHYDPWWNLAVQNQATDRAHRIGQTKKVTVYKLIVKNTIEEKIQELQETKKHLAEQVIGGEAGQLGSMSKEDLMALLEV